MSYVVAKPFNTATRRWRVGDPITPEEFLEFFGVPGVPIDVFNSFVAAGFIEEIPDAPAAPAETPAPQPEAQPQPAA